MTYKEVLQEVTLGIHTATASDGPDNMKSMIRDFYLAPDPNSFDFHKVTAISGLRIKDFTGFDCDSANDIMGAIWDTIVKLVMTKFSGSKSSLKKDSSWSCDTPLDDICQSIWLVTR